MKHHLVIPAAGVGKRFGGGVAKQYVSLCGSAVIERTLEALVPLVDFSSVNIGLAPEDSGWNSKVEWRRASGGASRAETVLNTLDAMTDVAEDLDWVWVHDAVRPLVSAEVAQGLLGALNGGADCFVAGLPAVDTLKRVNAGQLVEETLDRERIWYAQTPQVCRFGKLRQALRDCIEKGLAITDEASAMEQSGLNVKMVAGCESNIKITRPGDLALAESIYTRRTTKPCE